MIRWGILGAGNIAHRFALSLAQEPDSELAAISGRSRDKVEAFAAQFGVPVCYTSHEELLQDPTIDAIYLALPHGLHCEWAVKALCRKKAVLCEKPAVLTEEEMHRIEEAARENHTLFMEAMKTRFVPVYAKIKETLERGEIGQITGISTSLCNEMPFDQLGLAGKTYHTDPAQGGALWDCGIYLVSWAEDFGQGEAKILREKAVIKDGIDYYVKAELEFENVTVSLETAFDRKKDRDTYFFGTEGELRVREHHRSQSFTVSPKGKEAYTVEIPYEVDDFYGEIHHFVGCLQKGLKESPIMPLSASVRCARIIDQIRARFQYRENCLDALKKQEEMLQYAEKFGSREALQLGNKIAEMVYAGAYDREVSVRIIREKDETVLFQFAMDSKSEKNVLYMNGKRGAAKRSNHASIWDYVYSRVYGTALDQMGADYMPVGGAFPIRVNGEWVATLTVSGLHEGEDHELCVRALEEVLGVRAPAFPGILI